MPDLVVPGSVINTGVEHGLISRRTNEAVIVEDWKDKICSLVDNDAPFFVLSKRRQMATGNPVFNWGEYQEDAPIVDLPSDTVVSSDGMVLPARVNLRGMVRDHIVRVSGGVDSYRVISNPEKVSGGHRVRLFKLSNVNMNNMATTEVAATVLDYQEIKDSGRLHLLYVSKPEANDDVNPVKRYSDNMSNTITTFETYTEISKHRAATKRRDGLNEREWQLGLESKAYAKQIERALFVGQGYDDGDRRMATKGLLNFDIQRCIAEADNFNYMDFVRFCEDHVMRYNKKKDLVAYVNQTFYTFLLEMLRRDDKGWFSFDATGKKSSYGMHVNKLVTPFCRFDLVDNTFLKEYYGSDPVMVVADMDKILVRYLSSNGESLATKYERGVQPNHANYYWDKIFGSYGLQVENSVCHSFLHLKRSA